MPVRKTYKQEIRDFKFPSERLRIRRYDKVLYSVTRNHHSEYFSLDQRVQEKLVLRIKELGKESPPLFYRHDFEYQFQEKGLYHIYCPDNPDIRQQILVEESKSNESDFSNWDLSDSNDNGQPLLMSRHSKGDKQLICFRNIKGQNFSQISDCLTLLRDGCPIQALKAQYSQFFDSERDAGSFERQSEKYHLNPSSIHERSQNNSDENSKWYSSSADLKKNLSLNRSHSEHSIDSFELKKLSLKNPDLVSRIFLKLKQKYQTQQFKGNSDTLSGNSVKQLALRVRDERMGMEDQVFLPHRHSSDILQNALKVMQSRFN